ncbi:hypothetical protein [Lactococcus allomyrinae]|nr:hypothetical protein [Lactococcus allomyrinae]
MFIIYFLIAALAVCVGIFAIIMGIIGFIALAVEAILDKLGD